MEEQPQKVDTGRPDVEDREPAGNATFIVLGSYKPESLEWLTKRDNDKRDEREIVAGLAEASGAKLLDIWYTTGAFDIVIVLGDATARAALTFALAFGAEAQVSTQTLAAEGRVGNVAYDAARARTQRGTGGRTQRGEGGPGG